MTFEPNISKILPQPHKYATLLESVDFFVDFRQLFFQTENISKIMLRCFCGFLGNFLKSSFFNITKVSIYFRLPSKINQRFFLDYDSQNLFSALFFRKLLPFFENHPTNHVYSKLNNFFKTDKVLHFLITSCLWQIPRLFVSTVCKEILKKRFGKKSKSRQVW